MAIVFQTFGNDGKYTKARQRICRQVKALHYFDRIIAADNKYLGPAFYSQHGQFVRQYRKGYGYWVWKPWVISKALTNLADGDVLVYLDAGFVINPRGRKRLQQYIEMARTDEIGWICFLSGRTIKQHTKQSLLRAFGGDYAKEFQRKGGIHVIRVTAQTRAIAREWVDWCTRDGCKYITDRLTGRQLEGFLAHRHDQSVFSLLACKHKLTALPNETWYRPGTYGQGRSAAIPFWEQRQRTH